MTDEQHAQRRELIEKCSRNVRRRVARRQVRKMHDRDDVPLSTIAEDEAAPRLVIVGDVERVVEALDDDHMFDVNGPFER